MVALDEGEGVLEGERVLFGRVLREKPKRVWRREVLEERFEQLSVPVRHEEFFGDGELVLGGMALDCGEIPELLFVERDALLKAFEDILDEMPCIFHN